jgi:L-ascorbate metabolism protein UlaG (beta-lactamase superfamily)
MLLLGAIVLAFILFIYLFVHSKPFGAQPSGERLHRVERSPNYRNGQFQNLSITPQLTEGASFFGVLRKFLFNKSKQKRPPGILPSKKTDLLHLAPDENGLVWFGHSSYFLQIDGKTILVDPVFSGNASPLFFTTKSFPGSNIYSVSDFPDIDYLFISHDHWDHLDYKTVLRLKPKVKKIVTALGVGAHLARWGFDEAIIVEKDWNEIAYLSDGFEVHTAPTRHFSGRGLKRNGSLWISFVLKTPTKKIYLGGDSGYDAHFKEIGRQYGPFDLAILENGQYDKNWKYIHMMPEETVQAALDLGAKKLLPVHWAKFSLSVHAWDEPIRRIQKEALRLNLTLLHPMIGEWVNLKGENYFENWWETV